MDGYNIKPLETTRIPRSHIVMAVESTLGGDRAGYEQTWRVGAFVSWRMDKGNRIEGPCRSYTDPGHMWEEVTAWADRRGVTFLWCHDLSWVARVSNAFNWLPAKGWQLDAFNLLPGSGWLVWRKGRSTLKFFDTMSVWQIPLDGVARLFGQGRKPLPPLESRPETWMSRVWRDMRILQGAVESYLKFVEDNDLGPLAITGSGQAWAAFRRRFLRHGVLIHDNQPLRAMERRAMWAGRAEAHWHGAILTQQVDEWDFTNAYTNIGRHTRVPVFPMREVSESESLESLLGKSNRALLAEVEVDTDAPVVPCLGDGGIIWPTGKFTTTLWTPELVELVRTGAIVSIRKGFLYQTAPLLSEWAEWVLNCLRQPDAVVPAWMKVVIKRWGNTLVGRFGMRYPQWELIGRSGRSDAFAIPLWDIDTDETHTLMQAGYQMFEQSGVTEPRHCAPMVTGYVMSTMRAILWRLMARIPREALLYVDTDSVLTTDAWRSKMEIIAAHPEFQGLRLKRSWDGFAIYGPRQIVTGDEVRFSGLPKTAERVGRHTFEGEITESLEQALGHNALDRVRMSRKRWDVQGKDTRRIGPSVGWTEPLHVNLLGGNDNGAWQTGR